MSCKAQEPIFRPEAERGRKVDPTGTPTLTPTYFTDRHHFSSGPDRARRGHMFMLRSHHSKSERNQATRDRADILKQRAASGATAAVLSNYHIKAETSPLVGLA